MIPPAWDATPADYRQGPGVLFVDDDPANLRVLRAAWAEEFRIHTAGSGAEALRVLEETTDEIGLVVTDQRMAGLNGDELLALVRERRPDIGTMLVTGYADLEPIVAAINRGQISGYLRKPWTPDEMRILLRNGLERFVLRRSLRQEHLDRLRAEQTRVLAFVINGVGHQVSSPVSALRLNMDFLQTQLAELSHFLTAQTIANPERLAFLMDDLATTVADCSTTTNDLMGIANDLRSLALQESDTAAVPTDVNDAVLRALRFLRPHLNHRAQIDTVLGPVTPALADPVRLAHLCINLVGNAAAALDDAPDDVPKRITVVTRMSGDDVVLEVGDSAPAIPDDVLPSLFDSMRVDRPAVARHPFGLALCARLAQRWNGVLSVHRIDDCNVFRVVLPVPIEHRSCPPSAPASGRFDAVAGDTPSVLVVDDDITVLRAVERCLGHEYRVVSVASGARAIELLRAEDFAAVLCDLQMPRPDGTELYQFLHSERPDLVDRVAFMSGGALSDRIDEFVASVKLVGANVLDKPFANPELRATVARLVTRKR